MLAHVMRRFGPSLVLTLVSIWGLSATAAAELKVGDQAPAFALQGTDGKTHRLADYKGKQVVVLAWFAKAFTSG